MLRNESLVPAASPLSSGGASPRATALKAGLNKPVPMPATSSPGSSTIHDVWTPATRQRTSPAATRARPPEIMAPWETRFSSCAEAPETTNITTQAGR